VPTNNVPQESASEEKSDPKVFNSTREMIVDFLTDEAVLAALPQFFGAVIVAVTAAVEGRTGHPLQVTEVAAMLRAELEKDEYRVITGHPLYSKFGGIAVPYIAHKIASQQSLYPHFRTETIQQ
jgi:hypothetical protein